MCPHPDYWPQLREICDRYGVLLIADEVITGFCRTGRMFAMEHWGVKPDIFTVAKALTSGYLPIGAAVATGKVADAFSGEDNVFQHLITFGGNPASCAAALANLDIMEGEDMATRSRGMGDYLFERLQTLRKHEIVGDVRGGMGLLCAVELVKDRETRAQFPKEAELDRRVVRLMREHRMLGRARPCHPGRAAALHRPRRDRRSRGPPRLRPRPPRGGARGVLSGTGGSGGLRRPDPGNRAPRRPAPRRAFPAACGRRRPAPDGRRRE